VAKREEAGVILAVPRVLRETAECSSTVAASVTGVSRSHGGSAASLGAAPPPSWLVLPPVAAPVADEAGGMAVIFASRPQPGALSLETQGASWLMVAVVLASLFLPGLALAAARAAVGGLSRTFSGNKSLVGLPWDANNSLGWVFGIVVVVPPDEALSVHPFCEARAEDDGMPRVDAAVATTAPARLVASGCSISFESWGGERW